MIMIDIILCINNQIDYYRCHQIIFLIEMTTQLIGEIANAQSVFCSKLLTNKNLYTNHFKFKLDTGINNLFFVKSEI
jgi:hypothetical protein